jgi:hypothetical protein
MAFVDGTQQQQTSGATCSVGAGTQQNFSAHARLLPYLEQAPVYNNLNFAVGARWGPTAVSPDPEGIGIYGAVLK